MGIWDFIYDSTETAVKNIGDAVENIGQYVLDDEGRDKMVNFSTTFVKNASVYAAKEAANNIPGVRAVNEIYDATVREMNNASKKN